MIFISEDENLIVLNLLLVKKFVYGILRGKRQKRLFLIFSRRLIRNSTVYVTKIVITFYLEIGLTQNWWGWKVHSITFNWIGYGSRNS